MSYSPALALEDFVPSVLSLLAFTIVARVVRAIDAPSGRWALAGGLVVVAGGLSRATWKLVLATTGTDLAPVYLALFPALAFGFPTLATATWRAASIARGGRPRIAAPVPGALALAALAPVTLALASSEGRLAPLLWLLAGTLGSVALSLILAGWARRAGRPRIAVLLVINLVITIVLNAVARSAQGSEAIQWVQQGINTANQLLFLFAVRALAPAAVPHSDSSAAAAADARP